MNGPTLQCCNHSCSVCSSLRSVSACRARQPQAISPTFGDPPSISDTPLQAFGGSLFHKISKVSIACVILALFIIFNEDLRECGSNCIFGRLFRNGKTKASYRLEPGDTNKTKNRNGLEKGMHYRP